MIKCNLAVLLAEKGLKMVDVINRTGIAKATIRALYHNTGKGIQFETLNTLCEFLDITPGEFFSHIDFEVEILDAHEPFINEKTNEIYVYFICDFSDGDKKITGRVLCCWNKDEERFKLIIWDKLKNKLAKIPDIHLIQAFIDYFEENIAKEDMHIQKEIALYDYEVDDWMNSEFLENIED